MAFFQFGSHVFETRNEYTIHLKEFMNEINGVLSMTKKMRSVIGMLDFLLISSEIWLRDIPHWNRWRQVANSKFCEFYNTPNIRDKPVELDMRTRITKFLVLSGKNCKYQIFNMSGVVHNCTFDSVIDGRCELHHVHHLRHEHVEKRGNRCLKKIGIPPPIINIISDYM